MPGERTRKDLQLGHDWIRCVTFSVPRLAGESKWRIIWTILSRSSSSRWCQESRSLCWLPHEWPATWESFTFTRVQLHCSHNRNIHMGRIKLLFQLLNIQTTISESGNFWTVFSFFFDNSLLRVNSSWPYHATPTSCYPSHCVLPN